MITAADIKRSFDGRTAVKSRAGVGIYEKKLDRQHF